MSNINITEATIALIDSLKSTTGAFGLAGTGSEYKIVTEMFLYKFFNDKFGYEAKRDQVYGPRLCPICITLPPRATSQPCSMLRSLTSPM